MKKADSKENFKKILKEQGEETRRYLGALSEDSHSQIEAIAEQYSDINKKLDNHTEKLDSHTEMIGSLQMEVDNIKETLDGHTKMFGSIKIDMEIIKENMEFIKSSLKKKVDVEEFSTLEKRVALLEKHSRLSTV